MGICQVVFCLAPVPGVDSCASLENPKHVGTLGPSLCQFHSMFSSLKITNHTHLFPSHYGKGLTHLQGPSGPVVTPLLSVVTWSGRTQVTWTLHRM